MDFLSGGSSSIIECSDVSFCFLVFNDLFFLPAFTLLWRIYDLSGCSSIFVSLSSIVWFSSITRSHSKLMKSTAVGLLFATFDPVLINLSHPCCRWAFNFVTVLNFSKQISHLRCFRCFLCCVSSAWMVDIDGKHSVDSAESYAEGTSSVRNGLVSVSLSIAFSMELKRRNWNYMIFMNFSLLPNISSNFCCANWTHCVNSQHFSNLSKQIVQTPCGKRRWTLSVVHSQQVRNFCSIDCSTSLIDAIISQGSFNSAHKRQYSVILNGLLSTYLPFNWRTSINHVYMVFYNDIRQLS